MNQLPETEETLLLRIIGKGEVQRKAIQEILQMPARDQRREAALRVFSKWKTAIEQIDIDGAEDEAFVAALAQVFPELEQKIKKRDSEQD